MSGTSATWPSRVALLGVGCPDGRTQKPSSGSSSCGGGDPLLTVLDLSSVSGAFVIPANGSLELCGLRLEGAVLPVLPAYPLPAPSFLALSAFKLTGRAAGSDTSTDSSTNSSSSSSSSSSQHLPPPLILSHLLISTPSCPALARHQAFACAASPSPNFTITPTALTVTRYTTPTASITNVTLTCSGKPVPFPCAALQASSGTELLQALQKMESFAEINFSASRRMGAYLFLERDITLAPVTGPQVTAQVPPAAPPLRATLPPQAVFTNATTTRSAALAPPLPVSIRFANVTVAGAPDGTTVLDLADSAGFISVMGSGTVQLHNLTLRNLPVGLTHTLPWGLFRLGMWTFSFTRRLLGRKAEESLLLLRNVGVLGLPLEEVATYWSDVVGQRSTPAAAAPTSLRPCLCIETQTLFYGEARWVEADVPYMETSRMGSPGGSLMLEGVRVYAADTPTIHDDAAAAERPQPPTCLRGVVCQLIPEGAPLPRPWKLRVQPGISPVSVITRDQMSASHTASVSVVLNAEYTILAPEPERPLITAAILMGNPVVASVLDAGYVAPSSCLRGPEASLTLRHVVLLRLPPSGDSECALPPPAAPPPPLSPESQQQQQHHTPADLALTPSPAAVPSPLAAMAAPQLSSTTAPLGLDQVVVVGGQQRIEEQGAAKHQQPDESRRGGQPLTQPGRRTLRAMGLDPALANFTSCVWPLDFDRTSALAATSAPSSATAGAAVLEDAAGGGSSSSQAANDRPVGLPYVFLDSVILVVPQRELDVFVWTWANNSTALATDPGLTSQLVQMLAGSQLSAGTETTMLAAAAAADDMTGTADEDDDPIGYSATADGRSSGGSRLLSSVRSLTFERLRWCGLAGRNVTLTSHLPAGLLDPPSSAGDPAAAVAAAVAAAPPQLDLPVAVPRLQRPRQPPVQQPQPPQRTGTGNGDPAPHMAELDRAPPTPTSTTLEALNSSPPPRGPGPTIKQLLQQPQAAPGPTAADGAGGHRANSLPIWGVALLAFGATCALALLVAGVLAVSWWRRAGGRRAFWLGGGDGLSGGGGGGAGDGGSNTIGPSGRAASAAAAATVFPDAAATVAGGLTGESASRSNSRNSGISISIIRPPSPSGYIDITTSLPHR